MRKEIRGMKAVRYAGRMHILIDVDEEFILRAEGERLGRRATFRDIDDVFSRETDAGGYDPTDLLPGGENFRFLVGRYGDGWVYVAVEGDAPAREERAVFNLYRGLLKEKEPFCGGDILDLATSRPPRLGRTGFPRDANLNLLFHAALRLVRRGFLEAEADEKPRREGDWGSYGGRRFFVPADEEVPLEGVMCELCRDDWGFSSAHLHRECAARLRAALRGVTAGVRRRKTKGDARRRGAPGW